MLRNVLNKSLFISNVLNKSLFIRKFSIDGFGYESSTGKRIKDLKVGDIIKEKTKTGFCEMTGFNKMLITPDHPILIYGEWTKPREVKEIKFVNCRELYDIVLNKHHVITINGNNIRTL